MTTPAIVRFAPSPTGHFHIGNARTALYNFLLAKQTGGEFILRIEDTDQKRGTPESLNEIMSALRWLGINWTQGPDIGGPHAPYNQTARKEIYLKYAQILLDQGNAYRCFCSEERLKQMREDQQKNKIYPRYDGLCREISVAESSERANNGEKFVVRFKTPKEGETIVSDRLRGNIITKNSLLDDYILVRSNGYALYHLAALVDDHLMNVTHVFRSSEWLGTLPLHALIIRAFGWNEPVWCHLSVFLNPSGKGKMSKRNLKSEQEIFVLGLKEKGYLPEAINYWMALMGASFGSDENALDMNEMARDFNVNKLNPAPAKVNFEKLDYFNGVFIRKFPAETLAKKIQPYFEKVGIETNNDLLLRITPLIQPRITTLDDAVEWASFFFRYEPIFETQELIPKGLNFNQTMQCLTESYQAICENEFTEPFNLEVIIRGLADKLEVKHGQIFTILRFAVTGQKVSPPLFESMFLLGKSECIKRVGDTLSKLRSLENSVE